jgi:hypothetical protein
MSVVQSAYIPILSYRFVILFNNEEKICLPDNSVDRDYFPKTVYEYDHLVMKKEEDVKEMAEIVIIGATKTRFLIHDVQNRSKTYGCGEGGAMWDSNIINVKSEETTYTCNYFILQLVYYIIQYI